ncbi:2-polyprenylphenol 6-hydroxylase [Asticcacaulis sp. EMRT-3]|uniref:2-polyprenylphenol 6-hydroxylase n=1 Tax=Asticcacaulis sp. EMRT-3 TaxID=3040349 RepID=UPI0024AE96A7|nr:2-polyprenylphenol 6-hydroxylase [Asticcacaulis sp. EMRT-3]MDI7775955.1 2-polyprenylphenol 6-hydroxylase [Asticcacaulis sp. EMRT-3]
MASPGSWLRMMRAGFVLLRYDALIPKEASHHLPAVPRALAGLLRLVFSRRSHLRPGERYAIAFQQLGPAFIKLGQVLSTRGDIFGEQFIRDLSHLKDSLPPFPKAVAEASVRESLGKPVESIFAEFGEVIGSASIAQAHEAVLHDGRKVAVKILRPGIEDIIARDIDMLTLGAGLLAFVSKNSRRLEPKAFVETVATSLRLELDLRLEASACDEIGKIINGEPWMSAPAVVWHQVSRRVIVTEWAKGTPLSRAEALDLPGLDRKELADNLIRAFLSQALDHGVFHADLHEGNLFVTAPAHLTAIDFGIVGRLRPKERRYLAEMLWGFLRRDYKRVAEVHFEAGYVPSHHNVDSFAQALRAVGEPVLGQKATEVSMGRLLTQLFEITAQFDMHLRPELVLLQKTMVSVEGVARRIYPEHNLWEAARPVVKDWIARELSPLVEAKRLLEKLVERLNHEPADRDLLLQKHSESLRSDIRRGQGLAVAALIVSCAALAVMVWLVVRA